MLTHKHLWILVLLIALLLRLYGLGLNPVGFSHDDEIQELINAKSLAIVGAHSGSIVSGIFSPIKSCPASCIYGDLGSFVMIPWMWFFPLDLFWSKIPFVIVSLLTVYFTGKLFENLSKNKAIGLAASFVVAINPWAIHFGRTAYFVLFSFVFYLAALYIFTRKESYRSNLFYGTVLAIIGSLFYFGAKPILPLLVLWGVLYNIISFKKFDVRISVIIFAILGAFLAIYFILLRQSFAGFRIHEIGLTNTFDISSIVNKQRRVSLDIPLVRDLLINKYTVIAHLILENVMGFFSFNFLFIQSSGSTDLYYITNHAYNYLIDLPFLVLGIAALGLNFTTLLFTLGLVVIGVFPAAIKANGDTLYALRIGMTYPIISGIVGWGIYFCYQKLTKRTILRKLFVISVGAIYCISLIYFLVMYWYRVPIEKSQGWYFHKRVLASYITRTGEDSNNKIIVITSQPADTFNTYLFYGRIYNNKENILEVNKIYSRQKYEYKNTLFIDDCSLLDNKEIASGTTIFVEQGTNCDIVPVKSMKIANPRDAGGLYNIYNETLCADYPKEKYPYPRSIYDFQVEKMNKETFCNKWITDPD